MECDANDRNKQGRKAAALAVFIMLVTIASASRAAKWTGIACSVAALAVGVYYAVRGLKARRLRNHRRGLPDRHAN